MHGEDRIRNTYPSEWKGARVDSRGRHRLRELDEGVHPVAHFRADCRRGKGSSQVSMLFLARTPLKSDQFSDITPLPPPLSRVQQPRNVLLQPARCAPDPRRRHRRRETDGRGVLHHAIQVANRRQRRSG